METEFLGGARPFVPLTASQGVMRHCQTMNYEKRPRTYIVLREDTMNASEQIALVERTEFVRLARPACCLVNYCNKESGVYV